MSRDPIESTFISPRYNLSNVKKGFSCSAPNSTYCNCKNPMDAAKNPLIVERIWGYWPPTSSRLFVQEQEKCLKQLSFSEILWGVDWVGYSLEHSGYVPQSQLCRDDKPKIQEFRKTFIRHYGLKDCQFELLFQSSAINIVVAMEDSHKAPALLSPPLDVTKHTSKRKMATRNTLSFSKKTRQKKKNKLYKDGIEFSVDDASFLFKRTKLAISSDASMAMHTFDQALDMWPFDNDSEYMELSKLYDECSSSSKETYSPSLIDVPMGTVDREREEPALSLLSLKGYVIEKLPIAKKNSPLATAITPIIVEPSTTTEETLLCNDMVSVSPSTNETPSVVGSSPLTLVTNEPPLGDQSPSLPDQVSSAPSRRKKKLGKVSSPPKTKTTIAPFSLASTVAVPTLLEDKEKYFYLYPNIGGYISCVPIGANGKPIFFDCSQQNMITTCPHGSNASYMPSIKKLLELAKSFPEMEFGELNIPWSLFILHPELLHLKWKSIVIEISDTSSIYGHGYKFDLSFFDGDLILKNHTPLFDFPYSFQICRLKNLYALNVPSSAFHFHSPHLVESGYFWLNLDFEVSFTLSEFFSSIAFFQKSLLLNIKSATSEPKRFAFFDVYQHFLSKIVHPLEHLQLLNLEAFAPLTIEQIPRHINRINLKATRLLNTLPIALDLEKLLYHLQYVEILYLSEDLIDWNKLAHSELVFPFMPNLRTLWIVPTPFNLQQDTPFPVYCTFSIPLPFATITCRYFTFREKV